MTECSQSGFTFAGHFSRRVEASFGAGAMTSDAGGLLLRETDRRLNLLARLSACFLDGPESLSGETSGGGDGGATRLCAGSRLRGPERS